MLTHLVKTEIQLFVSRLFLLHYSLSSKDRLCCPFIAQIRLRIMRSDVEEIVTVASYHNISKVSSMLIRVPTTKHELNFKIGILFLNRDSRLSNSYNNAMWNVAGCLFRSVKGCLSASFLSLTLLCVIIMCLINGY